MKKALIYCGLFILLGACGSNPDAGNEGNDGTTVSQEGDGLKDSNGEETTKAPAGDGSCAAGELDVYLKDPDDSGTNIRKEPGGEVVLQLVKKGEEDAFFLTLTESKDGWFKIKGPVGSMEDDIEIPNGEGWIHGSVIAVNTRNYGGQHLKFLDKPENGDVVGGIKEDAYGLRIKDICGTWVKVDYQGTIGWIESKWLCGNPLTTCS